MAFALGLGSLFIHSDDLNMSYSLEPQTDSVTARGIQPDEEPCILHGHNRFSPVTIQGSNMEDPILPDIEVPASSSIGGPPSEVKNPYLNGDPNEIIPPDALPFTKLKPPPEEEDPQSIRTIQAWVVDVPDPRHIAALLKWLKQAHLDTPELGHLKRIRKDHGSTTFLIRAATTCTSADTLEPPPLPSVSDLKQTPSQDLALPAPYIISVPASSALTPTSLALKSALWPTIYTPQRKDEPEPWTRGKLGWAWDAMKWTVDAAIKASEEHQLPIAAHIPAPYDRHSGDHTLTSFTASDIRNTTNNPLRHSILNVIRQIADHHNATPSATTLSSYLLTDQTVFVTHEPCIMCSMALLHSRVKEVVYLYPMPKTGGCGGCACLPALKGVNHRFVILQWKLDTPGAGFFCERDLKKIEINDRVDA